MSAAEATVYVVEQGEYEDQVVVQVFVGDGAKEAADAFAELCNRGLKYKDTYVTEFTGRTAGWKAPWRLRLVTTLGTLTGKVMSATDELTVDVTAEYVGKVKSHTAFIRGCWRVITSGDATLVKAAHAEAVAAKKAEIIGK
ncbi:hypothetical protein ACWGA9_06270 [Streptomyces sp. NPDC054950]